MPYNFEESQEIEAQLNDLGTPCRRLRSINFKKE